MTSPSVRPTVAPVWGLAELAAAGGLFVFMLWGVGPRIAAGGGLTLGLFWAAFGLLAVLVAWLSPIVLHADPPALRGWGRGRGARDPGAIRNAWPRYALLTLIGVAVIVALAALSDPGFARHIAWGDAAVKLAVYLVSGTLQDLAVFGFALTRLRTALTAGMGPTWPPARALSALTIAAVFAAAHAPNWPFAILVFAGGAALAWLFWSRPSVLMAGASHAVLGTALHAALKLNMRIGPFYAHPQGHILRHVLPFMAPIAERIGW
jgi:hypothetical protein